jgi:hypothetical protein
MFIIENQIFPTDIVQIFFAKIIEIYSKCIISKLKYNFKSKTPSQSRLAIFGNKF